MATKGQWHGLIFHPAISLLTPNLFIPVSGSQQASCLSSRKYNDEEKVDDKRRNETRLLSTPVRNGETLQQLIINHGRYSAHFALREKKTILFA